MDAGDDRARLFVQDFIPKVSRTFALAIDFLPEGLKHPVFVAYLLCRLADTIEDSPYIEPSEKRSRLSHLKLLLLRAADGGNLQQEDISPLYQAIKSEYGDDHRLLANSGELFEITARLAEPQKTVIYRRAAEMAGGMAQFCGLPIPPSVGQDSVAALKDVEQWDRYCYFVAGTVGLMLTELFVAHFKLNQSATSELNRLGISFGLGLQKVNVIKDVPADRQRGVCFLPLDVMTKHGLTPADLGTTGNDTAFENFVNELAAMSVVHLDDAMEYILRLPDQEHGLRMFLTVPVFLAMETLNLVRANPVRAMTGPPVKLGRDDVSRIVEACRSNVASNNRLKSYYRQLARGY